MQTCADAQPPVVEGLGRSGCAADARVVVEKPFGRNLASAQALNCMLHRVFDEASIFWSDHYLGKETVQICGQHLTASYETSAITAIRPSLTALTSAR